MNYFKNMLPIKVEKKTTRMATLKPINIFNVEFNLSILVLKILISDLISVMSFFCSRRSLVDSASSTDTFSASSSTPAFFRALCKFVKIIGIFNLVNLLNIYNIALNLNKINLNKLLGVNHAFRI